ncbi:MAG: GNAT family N-acetyltransferase [Methanomicrobiales archaeon]|nr:GNAT family N-acetyltransferase [Methanomicrobiales archaeon]
MNLETIRATNSDEEEWDLIVKTSPHGTFFHTWKVLRLIERYSNTILYPLIVRRENENIGCFPFFLYRKTGFKMLLSPPPHIAVPRLGPIISRYEQMTQKKRESALRDFSNSIEEWIQKEVDPGYISFITGDLEDSRYFLWKGYSIEPIFNYTFDISLPVGEVWNRIRSTTRGNIRRAQKQGLVVRERGRDALVDLVNIMARRYEAQGLRMKVPLEFFTSLFEVSHPDRLKIFTVELQDELVTGNIEVYHNRTALSWVGAAKTMKNANDLLTWECIRYASEKGYSVYKIMGAAGTERLHSYYAQFNPELYISFSAQKFHSIVLWMLMGVITRYRIAKKIGEML